MTKLVVLNLGNGNLQKGFPSVTVQIFTAENQFPSQLPLAQLPAQPELLEIYARWQSMYRQYLKIKSRNRIKGVGIAEFGTISKQEFNIFSQQLQEKINFLLDSESFRKIDRQIRTKLQTDDEIRVIISTDDEDTRKLPWHLWNFFEDYPKAEIALSVDEYEQKAPQKNRDKIRILAILGDSSGIDVKVDRELLEGLKESETILLVEPNRRELDEYLRKPQGWDILFFAGHSSSNNEIGKIYINKTDSLTISQLKNALKKSIERGLHLAIFNSCDGLGLARELADLHIPQVIVMREPVPDKIAQEFLKYFLKYFSAGMPFYLAVREARERLQCWEDEFFCASWLPVICQNPAVTPLKWFDNSFLGNVKHISEKLYNSWDLSWFYNLIKAGEITQESIETAYANALPSNATDWILPTNKLEQILQNLINFRKIAYFFYYLSIDQNISLENRQQCKDFLEKLGLKKPLYNEQESNQPLKSFLMITISPQNDKKQMFLLNSWLIIDDSIQDLEKKYKSLLNEDEVLTGTLCQFNQIAQEFNSFLNKALKCLKGKKYNLIIEIFLPVELMGLDVDHWQISDPVCDEITLGSMYPIKLRSLERLNDQYLLVYQNQWLQNWDKIKPLLDKNPNPVDFEYLLAMNHVNWPLLKRNLEQKIGLQLTCAPSRHNIKELFKAILTSAIPIAIWPRCDLPNLDQKTEIDQILYNKPLGDLCESVRDFREKAHCYPEDHLGYHLALLWENPYRLTPDIDQEFHTFGQ